MKGKTTPLEKSVKIQSRGDEAGEIRTREASRKAERQTDRTLKFFQPSDLQGRRSKADRMRAEKAKKMAERDVRGGK
jgi:hypothetical protein